MFVDFGYNIFEKERVRITPFILTGNMHTITVGILLHSANVNYEKR
jgi:hypothetical protein